MDAWIEALVQKQLNRGMDGRTCEFCMKQEDEHGVRALIVAHPNGYDPRKTPTLDDLALWHQSCNIKVLSKFPGVVPLIERERAFNRPNGETSEGKPSSSEKAAAEKMRPRWDDWVMGKITRPSMLDYPFQLWQNTLVNIREWCDLDQIEQRARYACGLGSSKTYHTYALEDVQGGKFELERREGKLMIRYTHEYAGLVAVNLKASLEKFKEKSAPDKEELKA